MLVVYVVVCIDAFWIEPNWVQITRINLKADLTSPLKILHLSDLHIERNFPKREQWLIGQIQELSPDLILITGDIHQMDNFDAVSCRRILEQIKAPLGVYGVVGYDNIGLLSEARPGLVMLRDETVVVEHNGDQISITGVYTPSKANDTCAKAIGVQYRIALNHTPDLADIVAQNNMDLYMCGHTHGGQVRIPFWGGIITNAESGKRYEAGLYRNENTWIYTSRGLGLEPRPAPQVRFLCRPEITLITLLP